MSEMIPRSPDPDQNPQRPRNEIPISDEMNMDVTTRGTDTFLRRNFE